MKGIELIAYAAKALGYQSADQFHASTGIKLEATSGYNYYGLSLTNTDHLYASYSSPSILGVPADLATDPFVDKELIKSLKARVSTKMRQQRKLETIKQEGISKIRAFLSNSFGRPGHLIADSDITFMPHCMFNVAGVVFRYYGTITEASFNIADREFAEFKRMYEIVNTMDRFFNDKQTRHDSEY